MTTTCVALLRAVNVGGTGVLPMRDLSALCEGLGFTSVRTYIQSGNVVFRSAKAPGAARAALEQALAARMGKPVGVVVRTAPELRGVLDANPFRGEEPSKVAVVFCSERVPPGACDGLIGPDGERVVAAAREVYVHYPNGMGRSRLKLPAVEGVFTARNVNTVAKLAAMAEETGRAGGLTRR